MARKTTTASKARKKAKVGKREAMRLYGLPETYNSANLRYQAPIEKGILWYWFSLWVRTRDVEKWGTCISCDKPITVETSQAGHFIPAGDGNRFLFDERNVHAECPGCNAFDDMHLLGYAENLNKRYGENTVKELTLERALYRGTTVKNLKPEEYADLIARYRALLT